MVDPTSQTIYQTNIPSELTPYAEGMLRKAEGMFEVPYLQYQGDRFAQFTPLQQQAFTGAQAMQPAPQLADASALAGMAGTTAMGYGGYQPNQYLPTSFTAPGVAGQFMSPYMQGVVDVQQQQAQRQADIANQALKAQFARSGAFGGGRFGIQQQQAAADLMRQKQGIQAQGLQAAFQQAQQQFNQEQQQRQAAVQLGEQSRQFGAGLGLQGLQTALQGAGQLGQMGQAQFGQELAANQLQAQYGAQQQQKMQDILSAQYQDFLNYQNYPYKQLGFMSDIIRGVPLTQTGATVYQAAPSTVSQLAGLGTAAYGLSRMGGFAEGGVTDSRPAGLADLAIYNMGRAA